MTVKLSRTETKILALLDTRDMSPRDVARPLKLGEAYLGSVMARLRRHQLCHIVERIASPNGGGATLVYRKGWGEEATVVREDISATRPKKESDAPVFVPYKDMWLWCMFPHGNVCLVTRRLQQEAENAA